jgi:hypothetical protein
MEVMETTSEAMILTALLGPLHRRQALQSHRPILHPHSWTYSHLLTHIRHPIEHTTHSSSTNVSSQQFPHPANPEPQHLPPSTRETTTTSSSELPTPTVAPETFTAFFSFFDHSIQKLQKQIQHYNQYASSKDSWTISFVKVFTHSSNMVFNKSHSLQT